MRTILDFEEDIVLVAKEIARRGPISIRLRDSSKRCKIRIICI